MNILVDFSITFISLLQQRIIGLSLYNKLSIYKTTTIALEKSRNTLKSMNYLALKDAQKQKNENKIAATN